MGLTSPKGYQDTLGDGLEFLLNEGKASLPEIVAGLNALNVPGPDGRSWTEELLTSELARLAP